VYYQLPHMIRHSIRLLQCGKKILRAERKLTTLTRWRVQPIPSLGPIHKISCRTMFIQTQETPNPQSLKFHPGKPVLDHGSADFQSFKQAQKSPLARKLFQIPGVRGIFFGSDFISVTISEDTDWQFVKPDIFGVITDFYATGEPVMPADAAQLPGADTVIHEDDDEVVAVVKEILESKIKPHVQEDGGDILYKGFNDGIVYLQMQGSCVGCPSSAVTLKSGIENMLMHYVPEVRGVQEWVDKELEDVSVEQLKKLEESLNSVSRERVPSKTQEKRETSS